MNYRFILVVLAASTVSLAADIEPREIVRQAFFKDADIFKATRDYTYLRHRLVTEFPKRGDPKITDDETDEILILYGRPYERRIRKDGKNLSAKEATHEEEKLNKELERRKKGADKAAERERREMEDNKRAINEVSDAFTFRLVKVDSVDGRDAWVIDAAPNPGFRAKSRAAKIYPKLSGRLWIDQADTRLVKLEAHVDEKISFGWFLLQLMPGAVFEHERVRVDGALWLPKRDVARGEAKIGGMKTIQANVEITYSDYRRFKVDSTLQPASEH